MRLERTAWESLQEYLKRLTGQALSDRYEQAKALIQEKINKTQESIEHLKEVQAEQGERVKKKFMAVENLTEEQVEGKLNQIRNRVRNPDSHDDEENEIEEEADTEDENETEED